MWNSTMQAISFLFLLLVFTCTSSLMLEHKTVATNTQSGEVRGFSVPFRNDTNMRLDVYVGIPYARPPVGELRFQLPQPADPWVGDVYNATSFGPACPQIMNSIREYLGKDYNNTSEDCLYINVYAPKDNSSERKFPVMVWIHGGSYRYGSGEEYDGRILAQTGVVVVTFNYRLGVLGFLTTEDSSSQGNFGLRDQILAMQWVKSNIANFNGDPDQITIFGNSAGGSSVSLHLLSPLTTELFRGVIIQSGEALSPWAIHRVPQAARSKAYELGRKVGCGNEMSALLVECLRSKSAEELVQTSVTGTQFTAAFVPWIDNVYIGATPEELIDSGRFHRVPMMSGTVPDEVTDEVTDLPDIDKGFNRTRKESLMYEWSRRYLDSADFIYDAIKQEYDKPGNYLEEQRDLYIEMKTDDGYVAPHRHHVVKHSSLQNSTWLYSFNYRSPNHPKPKWMGVIHGEEYFYIFGAPFWNNESCPWICRVNWYNRNEWTETDQNMALMMMTTWSNFAKYGNPNPVPWLSGNWPAFTLDQENSLHINSTLDLKQYYKYRHNSFWNIYIPSLLNRLP